MPHQIEAVKKLSNGKILKGGVGSGKSRTALAYYNDVEDVTEALYIITTAKKRDSGEWEQEAELFGLHPVIDSWNNLGKYEAVKDAFFIFDEQRVVGTGAWVKSFLKISKNNHWIMLSATPGDTWMDYIPVFIANGFYKNRVEFLREHVVFNAWAKFPKVEYYVRTQKLADQLRSIVVNMPFETPAERKEIYVYVDYDEELFKKVWSARWHYLEERPIRNISEMCMLARRVCNTDPSRLERIRDFLVLHPRLIIFYTFDYELTILRELNMVTQVAEWNGHKHENVPGGDEWVYLVQYASGSEGWNCVSTDAMVFYSLTYSYRQFEQAKGRIDRMNQASDQVTYYILKSSSKMDNGIYASLVQKKDFNEEEYVRRNV